MPNYLDNRESFSGNHGNQLRRRDRREGGSNINTNEPNDESTVKSGAESGESHFEILLKAAQTGQEWAIEELYRDLNPRLLRYLRYQDPNWAEDLAAETWLAVASQLNNFAGDEGGFRAWVFTIAKRRLIDHRRKVTRRKTQAMPAEQLNRTPAPIDMSQTVVDDMAAMDAIARIMEKLPKEQAEILALRILGGFNVEETSRILGKSPGSIRVMQHRALKHLRKTLDVT